MSMQEVGGRARLRAYRAGASDGLVPSLSTRIGFVGLIAITATYYLFLLSNGTFQLFAPELLDRAFDSMLVHLLHGEFDVDPRAIDFESLGRNGKTYAYFGIFPALLRIVAIPFTDIARVELARLSCLTAVVIFVAIQLRTLMISDDSLPEQNRNAGFFAVMAMATILSGPQLYILGSAWIYHEPILWAAAMGAAFNMIVLQAALSGGSLDARELVLLAVLAGLALNTRAPIGVALYLNSFFLIGWTAWRRYGSTRPSSPAERRAKATISGLAHDARLALPLVALGGFAVVAGIVNWGRWGNPFRFVDYHDYGFFHRHPELAIPLANYGQFNPSRLWIGALYYTTGIPFVLKHVPPFDAYLAARYTGVEAPPSIPLLANPLTVILAGVGLYRLCSRPRFPPGGATILRLTLAGNASAVLLIFSACYLALRYRFDLAPFMTLAAFIGYYFVSISAAEFTQERRRWMCIGAVMLCAIGVLFSHYVLLIHKIWSAGVPIEVRRSLAVFAPFAFR